MKFLHQAIAQQDNIPVMLIMHPLENLSDQVALLAILRWHSAASENCSLDVHLMFIEQCRSDSTPTVPQIILSLSLSVVFPVRQTLIKLIDLAYEAKIPFSKPKKPKKEKKTFRFDSRENLGNCRFGTH